MRTIKEVKEYFDNGGTEILNEAAGFQFVKRADGDMLQFSMITGKYIFYKTFDGFAKAVLWRIKRG